MVEGMAVENELGPVFSPTGPDAELYGAAEGFPIADRSLPIQPGNPYQPKYRVGAFSHFDEIYPTRRIKRAATPWMFKRSQAEFSYSYRGNRSSLTEYLSRNPVTGLLIARDDEIFFEHYQYGRTDRDRLISQSMAKSITGMLIGIAIFGRRDQIGRRHDGDLRAGIEGYGIWQDADPRPASYVLGR